MLDVTRRGFLAGVSLTTGVGIASGLGLHTLLPREAPETAQPAASAPPALAPDAVTLAGPMVLHIRDLATAEVAMMVGTQELVYRDPELVSRLVQTAASAARAEG